MLAKALSSSWPSSATQPEADLRKLAEPNLVIATLNQGKLAELCALFAGRGVRVSSAAQFGLRLPEETENTFEGNAGLKARFAARETGLPALSDDSGLEIEALDGKPGVRTAEWAEFGGKRDFPAAMAEVHRLIEASGKREPWMARFRTAICIAWPDGEEAVFNGEVIGRVVWPTRGTSGFGYDPMFMPEGEQRTFAEMRPNEKNGFSHRARAVRKFMAACLGD